MVWIRNYNGDKNRKYNINYEIHSLKELENILYEIT